MECRKLPIAEVNDTLTCGKLIGGEIGVPGEMDLVTFSGRVGQIIDLTLVETSNWGGSNGNIDARMRVFAPSGADLGVFDSNALATLELSETGTYVIRITANQLTGIGMYNLGETCS